MRGRLDALTLPVTLRAIHAEARSFSRGLGLAEERPAAGAPFWSIRAEAGAPEADLYISDVIGWDTRSAEFVRDLAAVKAETLNVYINSGGGDIFDGLQIFNALKRHPARVVTHADGLAASIASVVLMAGREVRAYETSLLFVHKPWMLAIGNADDMREAAVALDTAEDRIARVYAGKSGQSLDTIKALLAAETWLTGEEALALGLVDSVVKNTGEAEAAPASGTEEGGASEGTEGAANGPAALFEEARARVFSDWRRRVHAAALADRV